MPITIPIHSHKKLNSLRFTDTEMGAAFTDLHTLIDSNKISMETKTAICYCIKIYYLLYSSINSLSIFHIKIRDEKFDFSFVFHYPEKVKRYRSEILIYNPNTKSFRSSFDLKTRNLWKRIPAGRAGN